VRYAAIAHKINLDTVNNLNASAIMLKHLQDLTKLVYVNAVNFISCAKTVASIKHFVIVGWVRNHGFY